VIHLKKKNITTLDETRSEYEPLSDHFFQGKIIRSKATWFEQGEENSKCFLNFETTKTKRTSVRRLINADEKLVLNKKSIMKELEDFYLSLYKNSESTDCDRRFQDFLNGVDIPKLSDDQKNLFEELLSNNECVNSLSKFPTEKHLEMTA